MDNPIYTEYQEWAKEVVFSISKEDLRVLKTDTFNEAYTKKPILPTTDPTKWFYVEINKSIAYDAIEKFPDLNIELGDVRHLDFHDETFDVVLDFSTIDHFKTYQAALNEYLRVLRHGGILLIVVWTDEELRFQQNEDKNCVHRDAQYYFSRKEFEGELRERFGILEIKELPDTIGGDGLLMKYVCQKE